MTQFPTDADPRELDDIEEREAREREEALLEDERASSEAARRDAVNDGGPESDIGLWVAMGDAA